MMEIRFMPTNEKTNNTECTMQVVLIFDPLERNLLAAADLGINFLVVNEHLKYNYDNSVCQQETYWRLVLESRCGVWVWETP